MALALLAAMSLWAASATAAADSPPDPAASADPAASVDLPSSAGGTGYDDLVAACRILNSDAVAAVVKYQADAPLAEMRRALADPACRRALTLVQDGLAKLTQPPADNQPVDVQQVYPEIIIFRFMRLLATAQYVWFADGRSAAAIDSFREALLVPDACLSDRGIDSEGIDALTCHLAQWSLPDCERVLSTVRERIRTNPEPGSALMALQRRGNLAGLEQMRTRWRAIDSQTEMQELQELQELQKVQELPPLDIDLINRAIAEWNDAVHDPVAQERILREMRQGIDAEYDQTLAQDPFGAEIDPPLGDAAAGENLQIGPYAAMYGRIEAARVCAMWRHTVQSEVLPLLVLGTHAAIRRYRWENGRLPAHLIDLKMPDITTDPCTRQPFDYTPTADGAGYTIAVKGADGKVISKSVIGPQVDTWK